MKLRNCRGTYVLILRSFGRAKIAIGKLGLQQIQPGYYIYVGSAFGPGGLQSRLSRHRRRSTRRHWHIDYVKTKMTLRFVLFSCDPVHREHQWAEQLQRMKGVSIPIEGFGSSDCRCPAHLFFSDQKPRIDILRRRIHQSCPDHRTIYRLTTDDAAERQNNLTNIK